MNNNSEIEAAFIKAFQFLIEFCPKIKDETFSLYFKNEIQGLYKLFIEFASTHSAANCKTAAGSRLIFQIDNLLNIISLSETQEAADKLICRKIQKALLEFKLIVIQKKNILIAKKGKNANSQIVGKSMTAAKETFCKVNRNEYKLKIKELINKKGFLTSNEVYNQFPGIKKRNIRRFLSDLLDTGEIVRSIDGNTSVYSAGLKGDLIGD